MTIPEIKISVKFDKNVKKSELFTIKNSKEYTKRKLIREMDTDEI